VVAEEEAEAIINSAQEFTINKEVTIA